VAKSNSVASVKVAQGARDLRIGDKPFKVLYKLDIHGARQFHDQNKINNVKFKAAMFMEFHNATPIH